MNFEESVAFVHSLESLGWRLGLDRMRRFVEACSLEQTPNFIHVAGTNGKGSVTAYLQSLLVEQGYRTGAAFSPFVYDIRERIQLGRELVSKDAFADVATRLRKVSESTDFGEWGPVTEFEFKIAMAFQAWSDARTEWAALEVGLGGRLDATNIVMPKACVIVSIGYDHMHILGNTLGEIAGEKAGILKPRVPCVVGQVPDEAAERIREIGDRVGAPLYWLGKDFTVECDEENAPYISIASETFAYDRVEPGILGAKQNENLALAIVAMHFAAAIQDPEKLSRGSQLAKLPGRFELRDDGRWILDGAHNAESAAHLRQSMDQQAIEESVLITNMLRGHEPEQFYEPLSTKAKVILVPPIDFPRARTPHETAQILRNMGLNAVVVESVEDAVEKALAEKGPTLITGSFYLVGEVGRFLDSRVT